MVFDDPLLPGRNGSTYLAPCILSHQPIDAGEHAKLGKAVAREVEKLFGGK